MNNKDEYYRKKELRLCTKCGVQDEYTLAGRVLCERCTEKKRLSRKQRSFAEYQRAYYQKRKSQLVCTQCGSQDQRTLAGSPLCASCGEKQAVRSRKRRQGRILAGLPSEAAEQYQWAKQRSLCYKCYEQDAYTLAGRALCASCYEKARERDIQSYPSRKDRKGSVQREKREERKSLGLCPGCGKPSFGGYVLCPTCRAKSRRAYAKRMRASGKQKDLRGAFGYCSICNKQKASPGKKTCPSCAARLRNNLSKVYGGLGPKAPRPDAPWAKLEHERITEIRQHGKKRPSEKWE